MCLVAGDSAHSRWPGAARRARLSGRKCQREEYQSWPPDECADRGKLFIFEHAN